MVDNPRMPVALWTLPQVLGENYGSAVELVVDEMEYLVKNFMSGKSSFLMRPSPSGKTNAENFEEVLRRDQQFNIRARVDTVDREVVRGLKAGLRSIQGCRGRH